MRVLAEYPSSSSDEIHEVREGDDGVVYCTCKGWRFHNRRWCKHLENYTQHISEDVKKKFKQVVTEGTSTHLDQVTEEVIRQLKGEAYGR